MAGVGSRSALYLTWRPNRRGEGYETRTQGSGRLLLAVVTLNGHQHNGSDCEELNHFATTILLLLRCNFTKRDRNSDTFCAMSAVLNTLPITAQFRFALDNSVFNAVLRAHTFAAYLTFTTLQYTF